MTNADRPRLARVLALFAETFREPVSDVRLEAYCVALSDLPIEAIESSTRICLQQSKYFPRPAEIREAIGGNTEDQAEVAWAAMLREVRRVGYIGKPELPTDTLDAIRSIWGSWRQLCETLPGEGPELLGWRKAFAAAYHAHTIRQRELGPSKDEARAWLKQIADHS